MTTASRLFLSADDVLRGITLSTIDAQQRHATRRHVLRLTSILVCFGATYGVAMGSYSGFGDGHAFQMLYSALKVPLLLVVTFVIAIPSFFVLNTLLGVRDDFRHTVRALFEAQAGVAIVLASLAPVTLVWYASVDDYALAILFNAGIFGLASLAGQRMLRRAYEPLIERNSIHRQLLRGWLVIYAFVGIQLGWVLRPFVGDPYMAPTFFRSGAWGNAYMTILNLVVNYWR